MWQLSFLFMLLACTHAFENSSYDAASTTGDIYNICPVAVDFTKEQDDISNAELKANAADEAMSAYLLSHPNNTLWEYFKLEEKHNFAMFKRLPLSQKVVATVKRTADFTVETTIQMAHMIADATEWILHSVMHPFIGAKQVAKFFTEFGKNIKTLWKLLLKDPKTTSKNIGGGFLLHIAHHPEEFTAETVLLITTGFAVIHGLIHGAEAVFGAMSSAITNTLLSVLMFIHAIDDPIFIVTPLITSIADTAGMISLSSNTTNSSVLTIDTIQPLPTCQIPEQYRPVFSSHDICLSTSRDVRQLIFGTTKRSSAMSSDERIAAYNHFHDFVCCYMKDQEFEVNAPDLDPNAFEPDLVPTPVKMANCSQRLGSYGAVIS